MTLQFCWPHNRTTTWVWRRESVSSRVQKVFWRGWVSFHSLFHLVGIRINFNDSKLRFLYNTSRLQRISIKFSNKSYSAFQFSILQLGIGYNDLFSFVGIVLSDKNQHILVQLHNRVISVYCIFKPLCICLYKNDRASWSKNKLFHPNKSRHFIKTDPLL